MQRSLARLPVEAQGLQGQLCHHRGISSGFCPTLNHISLKGQSGKERERQGNTVAM